ncbi:DUF1700 domain-containing protein [Mycoplasmatota bacterium]|nr:DUF1700 domain-containing protein [Mycoplasmatota bacterium]
MKNEYLDELRHILENHQVSEKDIDEILSDYTLLYDEGLNKDMSDKEIRELLGEPRNVYEDLKDTLTFIFTKSSNNKFVALTPFLATIIFMVIGFTTQTWHPTWLIFLLIPISGVLSRKNKKKMLVSLSPFIALIAFILLSYFTEEWPYTWLIFLLIPISGLLYKRTFKSLMRALSFFAAIAFYLYMAVVHDQALIGLLGFLLPIVVNINIVNFSIDKHYTKQGITILFFVLLYITAFLLVGFYAPNAWVYAWQILLLIPVTAIILSGQFRWVAVMPFIATIIFFSTGYFFQMFHISWLAFLLIPMVGILSDQKTVTVKKNPKY